MRIQCTNAENGFEIVSTVGCREGIPEKFAGNCRKLQLRPLNRTRNVRIIRVETGQGGSTEEHGRGI